MRSNARKGEKLFALKVYPFTVRAVWGMSALYTYIRALDKREYLVVIRDNFC